MLPFPKAPLGPKAISAPTLTSLEAARPVGAVVEGVDPTALPVEDLDALENLLSFEAAPRSLIAWARSAAPGRRLLGGRPVDVRALRLAYEWIFRYSRAVHHRAVSGATHSATRWALARVGHAAAPSRLERVARCALWSLGYGFRAGPAVAAWLVCAAVAWVVAAWRTSLGLGAGSLLGVMFLPVGSLLRVGSDAALVPALRGLPRLAVTAAVALPLAFAIVGLRNQLRQPSPP
jgi:hypothetical protein